MIELSFSVVINPDQNLTVKSLREFTIASGGGLERDEIYYRNSFLRGDRRLCSIFSKEGKTTITYPKAFVNYIDASKNLSDSLSSTVYTFVLLQDYFWVLHVFKRGDLIARFNPVSDIITDPDAISQYASFNFNYLELCDDFNVEEQRIHKYFLNWSKTDVLNAYDWDEFGYHDYMQGYSLIATLGFSYSEIINYEYEATAFKLWTSQLPYPYVPEELTREDILNTKRYIKGGQLQLEPDEAQYLFNLSLRGLVGSCSSCGGVMSTNAEFTLSIDQGIVFIKSNCESCEAETVISMGITDPYRFRDILNR